MKLGDDLFFYIYFYPFQIIKFVEISPWHYFKKLSKINSIFQVLILFNFLKINVKLLL